ncbi:hypothetical protein FGB62_91g00 [Gracilaria domingensis]|nr:hypothetical protein FGB62_91g00 [Gracilaria domingensis]
MSEHAHLQRHAAKHRAPYDTPPREWRTIVRPNVVEGMLDCGAGAARWACCAAHASPASAASEACAPSLDEASETWPCRFGCGVRRCCFVVRLVAALALPAQIALCNGAQWTVCGSCLVGHCAFGFGATAIGVDMNGLCGNQTVLLHFCDLWLQRNGSDSAVRACTSRPSRGVTRRRRRVDAARDVARRRRSAHAKRRQRVMRHHGAGRSVVVGAAWVCQEGLPTCSLLGMMVALMSLPA